MSLPELTADCSRCTALCCMSMAFDAGEEFAYDKPAGEGCQHLDQGFGCKIHTRRSELGFSGCAKFDCHGAGQVLTEQVFPGVDWRVSPDRIPAIIDGFRALREVHRLLTLLQLTERLPLAADHMTERAALIAELCPAEGWNEARLQAFEAGDLPTQVTQFLQSLAALVPQGKKARGP